MLFLAALFAGAQTVANAPPAPEEKPKLVCRTYQELGSRLHRRRVCKTAKDWDLESRLSQDQFNRDREDRQRNPG